MGVDAGRRSACRLDYLFDLWMVFSIALLLALVGNMRQPERATGDTAEHDVPASAAEELEPVTPTAQRLERFRSTNDELTGEGERLGTAYRLRSGEVVYVPEGERP
ncbi:MAG: DUF2149 domain-containing protein [Patescibacteria group bacterium]|nr:DUF2149 domain-containing protein [Patescibacteria group bacterium]